MSTHRPHPHCPQCHSTNLRITPSGLRTCLECLHVLGEHKLYSEEFTHIKNFKTAKRKEYLRERKKKTPLDAQKIAAENSLHAHIHSRGV